MRPSSGSTGALATAAGCTARCSGARLCSPSDLLVASAVLARDVPLLIRSHRGRSIMPTSFSSVPLWGLPFMYMFGLPNDKSSVVPLKGMLGLPRAQLAAVLFGSTVCCFSTGTGAAGAHTPRRDAGTDAACNGADCTGVFGADCNGIFGACARRTRGTSGATGVGRAKAAGFTAADGGDASPAGAADGGVASPAGAAGGGGARGGALASDANIDGEPGESVEVLILKGSKAGKWLPAVIIKPGNVTDCFDIRLPGLSMTHKDVVNVPGMRLRKAGFKVEISAEPDYPIYEPGEHAVIDVTLGDGRNVTYNCTVQQKGEFSNTYDVVVPGQGGFPGVHAKYMRKVAFAAWMVSTPVATTTPETTVLNFKAFMYLAEGMRADLGPVLSQMATSKKEMKTWLSRAKEWPDSCDSEDTTRLVAKMQEMSKATDAQVNASVPRECWRSSWNQTGGGGVLWDDLGRCFAVAASVSPNCAFCGVKLLLNVAAGCLTKCQPMMTACKDEKEADQANCPAKTGRCAECLQDPADRFLQCSGLPGRVDLSDAMADFSKASKAGTLDVAAALFRHVSPAYFDQMDHMTKLGLGVIWRTWKVVMGN